MKWIIPLFLLVSLYFFWPSDEEPQEGVEVEIDMEEVQEEVQVKPLQPETTRLAPSPKPIVKAKSEPAKAPAPPQKKNARRLPPGIVEFELLEGNWAIALGDIILGKLQNEMEGQRGRFKPPESRLWPSNIIPYAFSNDLKDKTAAQAAIEMMNQQSIMEFVPARPGDEDLIVFTPFEARCASYLGRIGGPQPIFLSEECGPQEVLHELMHALGFVHEQSREDRDQFVSILWGNIEPGFENQFDIAPSNYLKNYRGFVFAFDYNSVMLYSPYHFARTKGLKTIESLTNKMVAPSKSGLSAVDSQRLEYLYKP